MAPRFAVGDTVATRNGRQFTVTVLPTLYQGNGADPYGVVNATGRHTVLIERDLKAVAR